MRFLARRTFPIAPVLTLIAISPIGTLLASAPVALLTGVRVRRLGART
jgi:hypothetical protein